MVSALAIFNNEVENEERKLYEVFSPEGGKNFHFFFLGDSINTNTEVLLLRHH